MKQLEAFANQVLNRCASTNDIAKELGNSGCPHGTWVSTQIQESGRGRVARKWESIEGNLFLSVIVRVSNKSLWSWIPLTAAVAFARCLRTMYQELEIQIKWPNDLWLQGGKLGGILCEGSGIHSESFIVIGLGLNCIASPQIPDQPTRDLTSTRGGKITHADQVRMPLIKTLLEEIQQLVQNGPVSVETPYNEWAVFQRGTPVEWNSQSGIVQGLGPVGDLRVSVKGGSTVSLFAEDVSLLKM